MVPWGRSAGRGLGVHGPSPPGYIMGSESSAGEAAATDLAEKAAGPVGLEGRRTRFFFFFFPFV